MITLAKKLSRLDPTRTTLIRRQFVAEMTRRFKKVSRAVWKLVLQDDVFGLSPRLLVTQERQAWRFHTDSSKVTSFHGWLQQQIDAEILSVDARGDPWTARYVESSYKKGIQRAYVDTNRLRPDFYEGTQSQFLQEAFHAPETLSKLALLNTRTFEELRGVTAAMSQQMGRVLATGIAQGQGPATIAREMQNVVQGITKKRANVLARTEVIHAHAEGQLDSFDRLGVEEIGVMAEWSSADDAIVCEQCFGMEGEVMTVAEARGLIPLHPNCRCAWKPSEKKKKAKKAEEVGYVLPELPDTPEASALLATEKRLRTATAGLRKAYKGGDKSLRPALMRSKEELAAVRSKMDDLARGVTPAPTPTPTPTPVPKPISTPAPSAVSGTRFATAEDYRQYVIQQVKAAKTTAGQKLVDDLTIKSKAAWQEYMTKFKGSTAEVKANLLKQSKLIDKELKAARKAVKFSVESQRQLLNEVDSMVGRCELLADAPQLKAYQSVTNDMLSWIPGKRKVTEKFDWVNLGKYGKRRNSLLGSYSGGSQHISMFVNSKQVFAHEFGHHLGYQLKGFMRAQTQFYKTRTIGEKIVDLGYSTIKGKKDKWKTLDVYAGRMYSDGRVPEVVSVGLEHLWKNPFSVATKDPEWFNMLISQLKGIPTKAGVKLAPVGKAVKVGRGVVGRVRKPAAISRKAIGGRLKNADVTNIRFYSGQAFEEINAAQRGWLKFHPFEKDFLRRATSVEKSLLKLPGYDGTTYRVINFDSAADKIKFLKGLKKRGQYQAKQFLSTSKSEDVIKSFSKRNSVKFKIVGKSGRDISKITMKPSEEEVLFLKNSIFTITKIEKNVVYLTEI